jgi:hypothetical protein
MRFRQIIVTLWKSFLLSTDDISGHLYVSQSVVYEMAAVQEDGSAETVQCLGLHVHQT